MPFKNNTEAIAQLDQINVNNPGKITIELTAREASNIGALLERNAKSMLPSVLAGDELAVVLAADSSELALKLRKLAEERWG